MKYERIKRAKFIDRPNRFIANVDIDGNKEVVHVKKIQEDAMKYSLRAPQLYWKIGQSQ